MMITETKTMLDTRTGALSGKEIKYSDRKLKDLAGIFLDENSRENMDPETLVYSVQSYMPVDEGTRGGLFFGNTTIFPGKVGNEYFMTRGHFHREFVSSEYYWCVTGEGMLILMNTNREVWAEKMRPGSLHYIPGNIAHRVANTGIDTLVFNACWTAEAGHDYDTINQQGFSMRLFEVGGRPQLVKSNR